MSKAISIDEAINQIVSNYSANIMGAMEYASDKAVEDIYEYAFNCLDMYYANYEPSIYDRTDHLGNAILPYSKPIKHTNNQISRIVGVQYDPTPLEEIYYGSKSRSPVEGMWVLENYLKGVHPATNGGRTPETVVYYEIVDSNSPYILMDKYLRTTAMINFQTRLIEYLIR